MSGQKKTEQTDTETEKLVLRYLRDNPDYFERHLDLLADMILPHRQGSTISLIERQVAILREQKEELKKKLQLLINNAEYNEKLNSRINELILNLLDAASMDQVLDILQTKLSKQFNADSVVVKLFNSSHPALASRREIIDWSEPLLNAFEKIISGRKPVCGRFKPDQLESLFQNKKVKIGSAALIPLVEEPTSTSCFGMLAIGSTDPDRFHPEMGTLFLSQLAQVVSRILKRHLNQHDG